MSHLADMKGKIAIGRKQIPAYADEETWRTMLEEVAGTRSVRAMNEAQMARVLNFLAQRGAEFVSRKQTRRPDRPYQARAAARRSDYYAIPDGPLAPLKRKICAMWRDLGYDMISLDTRVKRQHGVEAFRWLQDAGAIHALAADLEKRLARKRRQEPVDRQQRATV